MRVVQRVLTLTSLAALLGACGDNTLKAEGDECFATSECAAGLTCDFGQDPPVCADMQTVDPDSGPEPDARLTDAPPGIDGPVNPIDAPETPIDAPETPIDAPETPIDAPEPPIDAPEPPIDAATDAPP